jgi:negative regulator of genetic competence, sporulation and motility
MLADEEEDDDEVEVVVEFEDVTEAVVAVASCGISCTTSDFI